MGRIAIGDTFGKLVVVEKLAIDARKNQTWRCQCSCGGFIAATTARLLTDQKPTRQCAACRHAAKGHALVKDMTGFRSGMLSVVSRAEGTCNGQALWLCLCDCGQHRVVRGADLRKQHSMSCGCSWKDSPSTTHGHARHKSKGGNTPTYRSWASMRLRCRDPQQKAWPSYGGRGIRVCDRWQAFENFLADMGERPDGTSIDRIDPNGHYEPGNCRWATRSEQGKTKRLSAERVQHILDMAKVDASSSEIALVERIRTSLFG